MQAVMASRYIRLQYILFLQNRISETPWEGLAESGQVGVKHVRKGNTRVLSSGEVGVKTVVLVS
jgi:hypothetical protein